MPIITPILLAFRQKGLSYELPELDTYNCIALSLRAEARPASQDEFEDYNLLELYDPGKKGALVWWCQDV
jgi:hypothetical protein